MFRESMQYICCIVYLYIVREYTITSITTCLFGICCGYAQKRCVGAYSVACFFPNAEWNDQIYEDV